MFDITSVSYIANTIAHQGTYATHPNTFNGDSASRHTTEAREPSQAGLHLFLSRPPTPEVFWR